MEKECKCDVTNKEYVEYWKHKNKWIEQKIHEIEVNMREEVKLEYEEKFGKSPEVTYPYINKR